MSKSFFFINYLSSGFRKTKVNIRICINLMQDNLIEIDSAMNMIKEEIIRELSESVSKQNSATYIQQISSSNLSFSEKRMD